MESMCRTDSTDLARADSVCQDSLAVIGCATVATMVRAPNPAVAAAATTTTANPPATSMTSDPNALLDSLDAFTSSRATIAKAVQGATSSDVAAGSATASSLDPVEFLNRHYTTESMLVSQLPSLRTAVSERMDLLEDRISTALQRQSETAASTRRHVLDAQASVVSLEKRIRLVQEKALQSEQAVLEITKDMKRLDCAKRHLQRTITTLKRLHMLVHAVEQLRLAALERPYPNYMAAAQLVDATRLLLQHFETYIQRVQPMRLLQRKVTLLQAELQRNVVLGFRIVGLGFQQTNNLMVEEGLDTSNMSGVVGQSATTDGSNENDEKEAAHAIMTPEILSHGLLFIDALGKEARHGFMQGICRDHLHKSYTQLFGPKQQSMAGGSSKTSFKMQQQQDSGEKPPYALDQVERRFAWYRRQLRQIVDEKYPQVFPVYWSFQYELTAYFLRMTKEHLLLLLGGVGPRKTKDRDAQNATILLKALQKTMLFEKEMMAWLQRDYGTVFGVAQGGDGNTASSNKASADSGIRGEDGELLEFDESGQAVAASSAQGIRIKYERQKRERQQMQQQEKPIAASAVEDGRASSEQVPVDPLMGVASSAFDNYMAPYIALEEQSMDEQLVESTGDTAVDARGELPVFTSSTKLFVYIKGSITRCTAMTKGKAFYLLYQAFQDSLNKYAQVLTGKLPTPTTSTSSAITSINIASVSSSLGRGGGQRNTQQQDSQSASSAVYKIPPGGEVTVGHVISTCEYCADTIEALEDLIRDTIDGEFQAKIDMMSQQEAFHDVTAKCVRVLVSGLENRLEGALKLMTSINWGTLSEVGEESAYVRMIQKETEPFVATVRGIIPSSYFRSFCDKFALSFTSTYYNTLVRLKRITEAGTQQLLLDVYSIKTSFLRLPVLSGETTSSAKRPGTQSAKAPGTSIAPAMYTKMITKQFKKIETLLKLVGTPTALLIDVFKVQWVGGSALDLQTVMLLKGMKRTDQATMLQKFGVDPATAMRGAAAGSDMIVQERVQLMREGGRDVAARVNSDLHQMRRKVDDFRRGFR